MQDTLDMTGAHGRPQKIFQGGQSRHFAYLFQIVGDVTQWTYKKRKCSMLRQQLHTVFSLLESFTVSKCVFK